VPYKAAELIQQGIESKVIEADGRAWQLLGDSWLAARERDRALPALEEAARRAPTGELYLRLGQVQLDRQQLGAARASFEAALRKGGLGQPGIAHLLVGMTFASEQRWADARRAFERAQEFEDTATAAKHWLATIESEAPSTSQRANAPVTERKDG